LIYHKYFLGQNYAAKDDRGPFKTYFRLAMAPKAIEQFAAKHVFSVLFMGRYDVGEENFGKHLRSFQIYQWVNHVVKFLTFGIICESEFIIVLKKSTGKTG